MPDTFDVLPVVFRVCNRTGHLIALFPTLAVDDDGARCLAMTWGGHCHGADYLDTVRGSRIAYAEEHATFKADIEGRLGKPLRTYAADRLHMRQERRIAAQRGKFVALTAPSELQHASI